MTKDILLLSVLSKNWTSLEYLRIRNLKKMPHFFVRIRKIKQQEITAHTSILLAFAQSSGLTQIAINSRPVKYISYDT